MSRLFSIIRKWDPLFVIIGTLILLNPGELPTVVTYISDPMPDGSRVFGLRSMSDVEVWDYRMQAA